MRECCFVFFAFVGVLRLDFDFSAYVFGVCSLPSVFLCPNSLIVSWCPFVSLFAQLAMRFCAVVCCVVPTNVHVIVVLRVQLAWLMPVCFILLRNSFARIALVCNILVQHLPQFTFVNASIVPFPKLAHCDLMENNEYVVLRKGTYCP